MNSKILYVDSAKKFAIVFRNGHNVTVSYEAIKGLVGEAANGQPTAAQQVVDDYIEPKELEKNETDEGSTMGGEETCSTDSS